MADQYISELLRISIAQICQTIGYNAIQTTPLELLQDNLHKFLHEFCRDLRRHVEHYNRNEANLDDVCLTLTSLNINVNELLEYILNVQPVTFAIDVPKFPVHKESNLNFLKPGSREVLIRPVHIYEHLPPILPPDDYANESALHASGLLHQSCSSSFINNSEEGHVGRIVEVKSDHNLKNIDGSILKQESDGNSDLKDAKNDSLTAFFKAKTNSRMLDEEGRPTREIGSVMMTTGGFISPAIEGKLPDTRIPDIIDILEGLDAPPPPPPQRSFTASRSSSRTSAATPTPTLTTTSAAIQKLGSEEKSVAPSNQNGSFEKSLTPDVTQTKQHAAIISPGGIANASSSTITAAAAMRLAKKHVPVPQSTLPPPLAARILKKAKKKSAMVPFSASSKLGRSGLPNNSQDPGATSVDLTEKSQRKRMKMLQKLVKSAKSSSGEIPSFADSAGKIKNLHGLFNPTLLDSMPSGSKRLQVEKILKRQAKHKQKLLRAQMAIQLHDKPIEQMELQQQQQQQQHKVPLLESPKVPSSKMIASAKHLSNFMPSMSHLSEKKCVKSPNIAGANTPSKKARKTSPTATQNFLNSIPGYRGMNALKTASIAAPVFGEAPFSNEQTYKDPPEIKTPEVKLSTEPDRSKLNIFKKISSKQKVVHRSLSPPSDAPLATQIFSGNDNQVINLPSGTTITPAPPTSGRHVYAPDDASFITVEDSNKTNITEDTSLSVTQSSSPASFFGKSAIIAETESPEAIHKPKKRGRKPGSKNQPKVPGLGPSPGVSPKKPKKMKVQKNLYGPPFQLHGEQRTEPLNLSHSFSSRSDMNSNIPLGIASTYPILDQSGLQKEVAERKKFKIKDAPVSVGDSLGASSLGMQPNSRDSSKKTLLPPFSAPTKEEVDSINRKLLKMDTVLQPAPPLQHIPMAHGPISSVSKEMSMSPIKSIVNTSPGSKHRSLLPRNSAGSFALSGSPLEGTIPSPLKGFPNIPPNLLPMLPMYSFPPRPGLIPTPGLFPSVLGSFPNKQSNPTANMLLQGFLPFPGLKPSSSGLLRSPGVKMTDKLDNAPNMESPGAERNYCNVAPLVPESVKHKLSSPGAACHAALISPKHAAFGDRDTPRTPQLKHSPTVSETIRESLQQKFSGLGTPDSRSIGSKSIPSTPGGISLNTFDCLMRGGSGMSTNSSTSNNSIGVPDTLRSRALSHNSDNLKNIPNIPTLNVDSPIEVSDDSEDASASTITQKSKGSGSGKHRAHLKPPSLPAPLLSHMDDLFIPIDNTKNIGLNQPYLLSGRNKEVKKNKKQNKTAKNSHAMSPAGSVEFCISKIGGDSGVGKLAGGADLIPLSATGLAYSSKTTPTNSLTASTASSSFEVNNREFGSSEVLGGDLSVTPSSDAHDKRKKLKKIKYGKIKKKKDKKDKTKNKEKYCEKIEKRIKEKDPEKQRDKDALKKIKKDKKREKQRSTRESLSSPTSVTAPNHNLAAACFDMNAMNLSNLPSFPAAAPLINTSTSSVVPKLTLKLGSCQSPTPFDDMKRKQVHKPTTGTTTAATTRESSPELARISPLVTRPPKQKSTSIDSSSHFNALGGVASSGSNSLGTFTTTELFGDKNRSNNCMNLNISNSPIPPAPSSWSSGGTLTASSTLLPQQLLQSSITQHTHEEPSISASSTEVASSTTRSNSNMHSPALLHETNRPSSYIDAEGNRVWICPACGKVDDGSAMIGCDGCDAWYHWVCVGIFVAPKDNEDWFCRVCIAKKKGIHGIDKKRKRNKKNK